MMAQDNSPMSPEGRGLLTAGDGWWPRVQFCISGEATVLLTVDWGSKFSAMCAEILRF